MTIVDLRPGAAVSADTAARLRAIHEEAFPPPERQYSIEYMLERAGRGDGLMRIVELDGRPVGYAYLELAPQAAIAFLWYIAIEAALRSRGLGGKAVADTLEMLRRDHPELRYAFFEVGRPDDAVSPQQADIDRRRREFYRRLGAYWVRGVDYVIPAADDPNDSVAYDPMFFALRDTDDREAVESAVALMASDTYADRPDDPRWKRLRDSLTRAVIVPPDRVRGG